MEPGGGAGLRRILAHIHKLAAIARQPTSLFVIITLLISLGLDYLANKQEQYTSEIFDTSLGTYRYVPFDTTLLAHKVVAGANSSNILTFRAGLIFDPDSGTQEMVRRVLKTDPLLNAAAQGMKAENIWELGFVAAIVGHEQSVVRGFSTALPKQIDLDEVASPDAAHEGVDGPSPTDGKRLLVGYLWYVDRFLMPKIIALVDEGRFFRARDYARLTISGVECFYIPSSQVDARTLRRVNMVYLMDVILSDPISSYRDPASTADSLRRVVEIFHGDEKSDEGLELLDDDVRSPGDPHSLRTQVESSPEADLAIAALDTNIGGHRIAGRFPDNDKIDLLRVSSEGRDLVELLNIRIRFWNVWNCYSDPTRPRRICGHLRSAFIADAERSLSRVWIFKNFARDVAFYKSEVVRWR